MLFADERTGRECRDRRVRSPRHQYDAVLLLRLINNIFYLQISPPPSIFVLLGTSRPKNLLAPRQTHSQERGRKKERLSHSRRLHSISISSRDPNSPHSAHCMNFSFRSGRSGSSVRADLARTRCLRELSAKSDPSPFPFEPTAAAAAKGLHAAKAASRFGRRATTGNCANGALRRRSPPTVLAGNSPFFGGGGADSKAAATAASPAEESHRPESQ